MFSYVTFFVTLKAFWFRFTLAKFVVCFAFLAVWLFTLFTELFVYHLCRDISPMCGFHQVAGLSSLLPFVP